MVVRYIVGEMFAQSKYLYSLENSCVVPGMQLLLLHGMFVCGEVELVLATLSFVTLKRTYQQSEEFYVTYT